MEVEGCGELGAGSRNGEQGGAKLERRAVNKEPAASISGESKLKSNVHARHKVMVEGKKWYILKIYDQNNVRLLYLRLRKNKTNARCLQISAQKIF